MATEGGQWIRSGIPEVPPELLDPGRGRWSDDLSRPTCSSSVTCGLDGIWREPGWPAGEPYPGTVGTHENDLEIPAEPSGTGETDGR